MLKWLESIKMSRKLNVSLICFMALMVVMGVFSLRQLASINEKVTVIQTNWMPSAYAVAEMKNAFNDWRLATLQYLYARRGDDSQELAFANRAIQERSEAFHRHEAEYVQLIVNTEERALYERSRQLFDEYRRLNDETIALADEKKIPAALNLINGRMREKKNEFIQALESVAKFQFEGGQRTTAESNAMLAVSRNATYLLLGLMTLFGLLWTYVVRLFSSSMNFLQRAGVNTVSSANQLAAVIHQQEATIREQAASSTEIVAASREIAATAKALSGNMDEIVQSAHDTSDKAEVGQQRLTQLNTTMQKMLEASNTITSKLAILNEKAGNINAVVNLIEKIADQTNLLSLNAAIESERAGEHGRGFSVVATEIRRLSDQTSVATFDIEQILKEMQSAVSMSVMGMDKFADEIRKNVEEVYTLSQELSGITSATRALSPRFEAIYEGMQAQHLGTEQITESMTQFNEGLQQTAQAIANSRQTVALLSEASEDLQRVVKRLG